MMSTSAKKPSVPPPSIRPLIYGELNGILAHHISRITVVSIVDNKLAQRSMKPADLRAENLVEFIEELMVGLRLFCDPEKLPDLMIELAEFCDHVIYASASPFSARSAPISKTNASG